MSDQIIGIAVLDKTRPPYYEHSDRLHVLCVYKDGGRNHDSINVHQKGTPPTTSPSWEYEVKGDQLDVTPSVRISTTKPSASDPNVMEPVELFHNDGKWSVKFVEFKPGDFVHAYDLFKSVNGLLPPAK